MNCKQVGHFNELTAWWWWIIQRVVQYGALDIGKNGFGTKAWVRLKERVPNWWEWDLTVWICITVVGRGLNTAFNIRTIWIRIWIGFGMWTKEF